MDTLQQIIKECPKAWSEACFGAFAIDNTNYDVEANTTNEIVFQRKGSYEASYCYDFRNLYDYFDGLGIGVIISPAFNQNAFCGWWFNIMNKYDYDYDNHSQDFVNRTEAEWNAFLEAFKIRENQL